MGGGGGAEDKAYSENRREGKNMRVELGAQLMVRGVFPLQTSRYYS